MCRIVLKGFFGEGPFSVSDFCCESLEVSFSGALGDPRDERGGRLDRLRRRRRPRIIVVAVDPSQQYLVTLLEHCTLFLKIRFALS